MHGWAPEVIRAVGAPDREPEERAREEDAQVPVGVSAIDVPAFVANGDSDPMILPHYSYLLAGLIPHAQVRLYPDSAHGFLFQHHAEFAGDVEAFLSLPQ